MKNFICEERMPKNIVQIEFGKELKQGSFKNGNFATQMKILLLAVPAESEITRVDWIHFIIPFFRAVISATFFNKTLCVLMGGEGINTDMTIMLHLCLHHVLVGARILKARRRERYANTVLHI